MGRITDGRICQRNSLICGMGVSLRRLLIAITLFICFSEVALHSQEKQTKASGHYLFAWTGDAAKKGNDFLAVIDADPGSASYGHLITTLVTDQQTMSVHHTEYVMPASGMLFANDHNAGRTLYSTCAIRCIRKSLRHSQTWTATCIRIPTCGYPVVMCWQVSSILITT